MNNNTKKYSFEEYKMMYESAEKVTDRRISLNQFNYSICTAVFLSITILWNWSLAKENIKYIFIGIFAILLISLLATIFTYYWIQQIKDYKILNTAKFDVINEMSKNLYSDSDNVISYEPFVKEWIYMNKYSAIKEYSKLSIKALKSSSTEFFTPLAFRFVFLLSTLLSTISIIWNFKNFISALKNTLLLL